MNERKSNIELLRIFSMFLIIIFHYVFKSDYTYTSLDLNTYIIKVIYFAGELGCNLFILITGYFYSKNKVTSNKIIKLLLEIYFYYIIGILIGSKLHLFDNLSLSDSLKLYFPITITTRYWFITAYLLLYLLSNYLNIIIDNINKDTFKRLLLMVTVIWSIIPTIVGVLYDGSEKGFFFNRFIWVVILYFIGAYINKYGFKFIDTTKKNILCLLITFSIMILSIYFIYNNISFYNSIGTYEIAYLWTPNNIFMLILSISIFNLFLKINIKSNLINIISSTCLGIYLIHDGPLDTYIWDVLFNSKYYLESNYPLLHILISSLLIFIVGLTIDLLRQELESITVDKILSSKRYLKIKNNITKLFNKFINTI